MGADIYLNSQFEPNRDRWAAAFKAAVARRDALPEASCRETDAQREVEEAYGRMYDVGYFRDSYNPYGLFAQLPLSWWNDLGPMLDDEGRLPIDKAREFRAILAASPLSFNAHVTNDKEPPEEGWEAYYEVRRGSLLRLIDASIEAEEPLYCSI